MRNLGDYARDTQHLSPLEHGFYNLLLDRYYATEEPIPVKDVYRVAKAKGRTEHKVVDAILGEFFERRGEVYFSRRCQQEIDRYREKSAKARESSLLGVEARRKQAEKLADAYPTLTEGTTERLTGRSPIRNPVSGIRNQEKESEAQKAPSEHGIAELRAAIANSDACKITKESRR